jgi:hypothetical protein
MPFLRSFLTELTQVSAIPYFSQRGQGLASAHFLHAFWQLANRFFLSVYTHVTRHQGRWW